MKKHALYILILIILIGLFSPVYKIQAQTDPDGTCTIKGQIQTGVWKESNCKASSGSWVGPYIFLAPLPCQSGDVGCDSNGKLTTFDPAGSNKIGGYLNLIIKIFIGLCAVLAVIMIVWGGIEYMTSELLSGKEAGRERITGAIFGLILALGAWTLLYQINPDILKTDLSSLTSVTVSVDLNNDVPQTYDPVTKKYPNGTVFGAKWDDTVGKIADLPYGVSVYNPQCTTVGQTNCTSTRGLDVNAVKAIQWGCKCNIQISGGTESWLHGAQSGNTSHQLGSSTVDLLPTPELSQYLSGGKTLINNQRYPPPNGPLYETSGGNHWHIGP